MRGPTGSTALMTGAACVRPFHAAGAEVAMRDRDFPEASAEAGAGGTECSDAQGPVLSVAPPPLQTCCREVGI